MTYAALIEVDTMSVFFAVLALASLLAAMAVIVLLLVARSATAPAWLLDLREDVRGAATPLAWVVALVATGGSLYYSEVVGFIPCQYCWYQRIAMYPLVLVLGVALLVHDRRVRRYALPMALIGAAISVYHYYIQRFPDQGGGSCRDEAPCTLRYVWEFDFVSIPFMAGCAFLLVAALMAVSGGQPQDPRRRVADDTDRLTRSNDE